MVKPTVLLIGTGQALEPIRSQLEALVTLEELPSWARGIAALEDAAPWLVLVAAADEGAPEGFVARLREGVPHCRVATVVVDPERGLTVHRWDTAAGAFVSEARPIGELVEVACELLRPVVEAKELRPLREVGFYKHLSVGRRKLHLQTEVLGREQIRVKSTVHEGGKIVYSTTQPLPLDVATLEQGTAFVRAQHEAVLSQADKKRF